MSYETGTEDLLASVVDGVLTLTLNRPAARNALSRACMHDQKRLYPAAKHESSSSAAAR
jgi:2-(1,2-epoxy-1,2-dihydrophenyl)acetyl-CoA isomerase